MVWDYYNPFLSQASGNQGLHVYRATRYGDEQVEPVLQSRANDHISALRDPYYPPMKTYPAAVKYYREKLGG